MMKLVPSTPLQVTIAVAIAVIGSTATVSWVCANGLRDIKQELVDLRHDMNSQQRQMWTVDNQKDWMYALDKANRFSGIQIPAIPEAALIKRKN